MVEIEKLKGKNVLVTGARGLIGGAVIELLLQEVRECNVYALVRSRDKAEERFKSYKGDTRLHILEGDVNNPLPTDTQFHFIIHAASNAHPNAYATDPVGTLWTNINGTKCLLDYGRTHGMERFLYVSSGEVYGNGDTVRWQEGDSGYVDSMTLRACYPASKRAAETLCVGYACQYGVDVVVARPCHTYGADFTESDNRAFAQFVRKARNGEDIVLKSRGEQYRSWLYVKDCATALLTILLHGKCCEAYNVADEQSCVTIKELAETIAEIGGVKVVFDLPSETEKKGFSVMQKAIYDTSKLRSLGWAPQWTLKEALTETIGN